MTRIWQLVLPLLSCSVGVASSFQRATFLHHRYSSICKAQEGNAIEHNVPKFFEEDDLGNIQIPSVGVSVSEEMEEAQRDQFVTQVVPVENARFTSKKTVAQLITSSTVKGSFEPVRYLVALSPPSDDSTDDDTSSSSVHGMPLSYVLVDVPPFSAQLVSDLKSFMGVDSNLVAVVVTSQDAIHYDEASSVYSIRRSDLRMWRQAFPDMEIVIYRLDTPRDCRDHVTQVLDGYGPFALEESGSGSNRATFIETGRPLVREEWDHETTQQVLSGKQLPPDDSDESKADEHIEDMYTPEAIRQREQGKRLLAVCTPGHSYGSMSFIFPETGVCCSGFTIPVEDPRAEENRGFEGAGPALDCRGYITTSRAGISRQMNSARNLVNGYADRFHAVLPSRGSPMFLSENESVRRNTLLDIIQQYQRIGEIYEQLGITSGDDDF